MRKIFLLVTISIFFATSFLSAQEDSTSNKRYEIAIGFCKPLGTYQYAAQADNVAYAQNGIYASIGAKSNINSFLGFKYSASVIINPAHNNIFEKPVVQGATLSVKNWVNSIFGVGTFFYSKGEISGFEIGLNIGMMTLNRPKISYNVYDVNGTVSSGDYYKKGLGFGFAIYPEVAFFQDLKNGNSLKFFANYVFAPAYIEYKKQSYFILFHPTWEEYIWKVESFSQQLSVSVANIGVGLTF
ncbi:MAG: hypothetical protein PHE56_15980 [Bacteroidales bacterium]|nr:hypothetical protein [Bacteroidales bacterium]